MPEYCLRVASDSFSRDIMCRAIGTCWGTVATHANYSRAHKTTRAVVERGIGQLKRRFHMRLTPDKVCKVIIACAILHNICKARQIRSRGELGPEWTALQSPIYKFTFQASYSTFKNLWLY
ncbi:hypothetical protein N1851_011850 [Merluccius polli]|uniref:DDE Tnp4 domain-containing protein n=1 Tax=Merluccius polli TaxID=89951 RepID=A0AA47MXX6_MERPO|nr:hypothetical protein N1851_011850 [Merluccius polli]